MSNEEHPFRDLIAKPEFAFRDALAEKAVEAPAEVPEDPWTAPVSRLRGKVDYDGYEYLQSAEILDLLEVPTKRREAKVYRRLSKLLRPLGWEPIRVKTLSGVESERVRGYRKKSDRMPYPHDRKADVGADTSARYIIEHVVLRLEQDSRWALARAVRALVAERDALLEKLGGVDGR